MKRLILIIGFILSAVFVYSQDLNGNKITAKTNLKTNGTFTIKSETVNQITTGDTLATKEYVDQFASDFDSTHFDITDGYYRFYKNGIVVDSALWDGRYLLKDSVKYIDFERFNANPAHKEGRMFYDTTKHTISYYNEELDVTVNWNEFLIRVKNETGSTISNGKIVYPSGTTGDAPLIGLADSRYKDKCRLIAMATHDIENGTYGYVTRLGEVGNINTSGYSGVNYLYLGHDGNITITRPDDGSYSIIIGSPGKIDAVNGTIVVDPYITDITVEATDINGFPLAERLATTLTFNDADREFKISPNVDDFHYYILGDKYERTDTDSITISNTTGLHIIYYDGTTIYSIANPTASQIDSIIKTKCYIAYVYWNATNGEHYYLADERHGISMSSDTHSWIHFTQGSKYINNGGITPSSVNTSGDGSSNSHAQFGVGSGMITDEDLTFTTPSIGSTSGLPVYYRSGSSGIWKKESHSGYSFLQGATPLPYYNQYTGGSWTQTEVSSGNFMLVHTFAINDNTEANRIIVVMGQNTYASKSTAEAAIITERQSIILGGLPFAEIVNLHTFILECKTSFTNSVNARYVALSDGSSYYDFRTAQITGISGGTGVTTPTSYLDLTDTPDSYDTYANSVEKVNSSATEMVHSGVTIDDTNNMIVPGYIKPLSIKLPGTSTGLITISSANTSANDYTITIPATTGTVALTSDIPSTATMVTQTAENTADNTLHVSVGTSGRIQEEVTGVTIDPSTKNITTTGNLFLGANKKIDFGIGDITLTNSSNTLSLAGGNLSLGSNNISSVGNITSTSGQLTFTSPGVGQSIIGYSSSTVGRLTTTNPNPNTNVDILQIVRQTSGSAANDISGSIVFETEMNTGYTTESGRISNKLVNVTDGNQTSQLSLWTQYNGGYLSENFILDGQGNTTITGKLTAPSLKVTGGTPGIGKVLTSDAFGEATWQAGGTQTLTGLTDFPDSYTNQEYKYVTVNSATNAVEFTGDTRKAVTSTNAFGVDKRIIISDGTDRLLQPTDLSIIRNDIAGADSITATGNIQALSINPTGLTTGKIPYKTSTILGDSPISTDGTNITVGGSENVAKVNVYSTSLPVRSVKETTSTNTVVNALEIAAKSTGTPDTGLGSSLELSAYDGSGNIQELGKVSAIRNSIGDTSGDVYISSKALGSDVNNIVAYSTGDISMTEADSVKISGELQINGSTSGRIGLKAPAVAGTNTFVLPVDGTNGQYLKTDGSGNLSFATVNTGNVVNSYTNVLSITSSHDVSVTWPTDFSHANYWLYIRAWYEETIGGKSVQTNNAIYNFSKTVSGFSLSVDSLAGYVEYFAADTTNLYPLTFDNYIAQSDIVTTVGTPGSDLKVPSEKAVRTALSAVGGGDMYLSNVQSVTGLKTFDKDKLAMKGTSTGTTVISTANTSATNYTATLPAKDGTFAMTSDIVSQVEDNITDGHTTIAPSGNAVFDALALKAPLTAPTFATSITGSYLTASEMLITDGSKNIVSAPVATYPSLTELSYVKGLTSSAQTQLSGKKVYHGVVARPVGASNPLPTNLTTTTFTLGATANPISYWYQGTLVSVTSNKTATLDDGAGGSTAGIYYVYFNAATGNILATKTFPGISCTSNVIIATVNWNGTNYGLVNDERHNYLRDCEWHSWAHSTVGIRYRSGITLTHNSGTGNAATFATTSGEIWDEDIQFTVDASSAFPTPNTCRLFYQTGASTYAFVSTPSTVPGYLGANQRPYYVNSTGYALTEMSSANNRYINVFVYATTSLHTPIQIFTETVSSTIAAANGYSSLANARAVPFPNLSGYGLSPEMKPLYRLIWRADGVLQAIDTAQDDYRTVSSLPMGAGTVSTTASSVSFNPAGNIASTTVQTAIEELDSEKAAVGQTMYIGTTQVAINRASASLNLTGITSIDGNAATVTTNANLTGVVTSTGNATSIASGAIKANMLQSAAADLGAADVTINLGNTNGSYNTNLTTDGNITATAGFSGSLSGSATSLKSPATTGIATLTGMGTGTTRAYTVPDADATLLYSGGALGTPASGTVTNLTGTASININGTVGATTPNTIVGTTIQANTGLIPDANDGAYIGTTTAQFSDLFLAEGGVINFDNGDATITQAGNLITVSGADLKVEGSNIETKSMTAGESVSAGELCYLKSDGKMWKADADASTTTDGYLGIATASISANASGVFHIRGEYTTSGLTEASPYYVSVTAGAISSSAPASTKYMRRIGFALSTTVLWFNPSNDYAKVQ